MMKPESQALVREFNRRLRAALAGAPNHVRVESALEVESHVLDVLSRGTGEMPEAEAVARILDGFGSPEQYARALLDQLPGTEAITVTSGLRDVGLSVGDLLRGILRLGLALGRQVRRLLVMTLKLLWQVALWAYGTVKAGVAWARGPLGNLRRWLAIRGKVAWFGIRRGSYQGRALAAAGGRSMRVTSRRAFEGVGTVVRTGIRIGQWTLRALRAVLLWTLRTAGIVAMAFFALAALAVAGFTALAPDLVGWQLHLAAVDIGRELTQLRDLAGVPLDGPMRAEVTYTGFIVAWVALSVAVVLIAALMYITWNSRRRRSATAGPAGQ